MPKLLKNGLFLDRDPWQLVPEPLPITDIASLSDQILPYAMLESMKNPLKPDDISEANIGVWLKNDVDLAQLNPLVLCCPIIAIEFPVFTDGRGFSIARSLRDHSQYEGVIRAIGSVLADQLLYLARCGFNEFVLEEELDAITLKQCQEAFSEFYQAAADDPQPLFRRRG